MRWDNIPKKERREEWYVVAAPHRHNIAKAAHWCRERPGNGYFYNHYTNTRWWFSLEADALLFALTWSAGADFSTTILLTPLHSIEYISIDFVVQR